MTPDEPMGITLTIAAKAEHDIDHCRAFNQAKANGDEVAALREALEALIVAVEWEVPPIRDGVNVDHRLDVLARSARKARDALSSITGDE